MPTWQSVTMLRRPEYLKVVQPKASCKRVSRTRFKCTVTGKRKSRKVTVRVTAYLQNGDFYGARG